MKLYKPIVHFETFYIYPFDWLKRIVKNVEIRIEKKRLIRHFNKLRWNDDDIRDMTRYSGSLQMAIANLIPKLLEMDKKKWKHRPSLIQTARELIDKGFETGWDELHPPINR